jgi:adenylate cyclase
VGLKELREEIDDEVSTLLGSDFEIEVTNTQTVPHASDPAITFPDVTARTQGAKLIETCVLYIDIRRSTELNFTHRPRTVARLYTAFVRAMTRVARHYDGHVRGIIGDRVMVIFDRENCFTNAVNCAIAMNTVSQYIINKHFKANEVTCGIGIDAGKMLATKAGVRRHGVEQSNYRSLVWLGRPANIASKLTDLANKPAETKQVKMANVAYDKPALGQMLSLLGLGGLPPNPSNPFAAALRGTLGGPSNPFAAALGGPSGIGLLNAPANPPPGGEWQWKEESLEGFLANVRVEYAPSRLVHNDHSFASFFLVDTTQVIRARTPPILMTAHVWKGFRAESPNDDIVKKGWIKRVPVKVPGYTDAVFGGSVISTSLKD